jgi:histidine triad (HIT) family protein
MADKTLFSKIIDREIPADIIHEDDHCIAFKDINPQAPAHILIVPRKTLAKLADARAEDGELLGHLLLTAAEIARRQGFGDGYRLVINNGARAGQTVFHLHVHLLAGRPMTWPPG